MKTKLKIILLGVIFLAVLISFFYHREKEPKPATATQISNANATFEQNTLLSTVDQQQTNVNTEPSAAAAALQPSQNNSVTPQNKFRALVENKNTLINFWGLVVDQDGNPLEGVKINGNTRTWYVTDTLGFDSRFPKVSATSDAKGKFEILNASGDDLTLKMEKSGYQLEPNAKLGFGYHTSERFSANPNSPIVFKMWNTNIHEQLITGEKRFHIVPDGRPYTIDLIKGTIAESGEGNLKVWIKYQTNVTGSQLYDWSSEIDATNGGLLQETNAYSSMYSAPVEGYIPTFQYPSHPQQIKVGQRGSTRPLRFYVKLRNGQEYGRITIELIAPYNDQIPGMIHVQYAINPTGSRILKP